MRLSWLPIVVVNLLIIAAVALLRRKERAPRSAVWIISGIALVLLAPILFGGFQVRAAFSASSSDGVYPIRGHAMEAISFAALATSSLLVPVIFCLLELVRLSRMPAAQSPSLPNKKGSAAQAFQFALLGATAYMAFGWMQVNWVSIATFLTGTSREAFIFDRMPSWLRMLHRTIAFGPWLIALGFLAFALVRKRPLPFSAFLGGILGTASILLAAFAFEPWVTDIATREPFEAAVWKTESGAHTQGRRSRMLNDLLRKHRLVSMTRGQINALLGVPPRSSYFPEFDYVYRVGDSRGLFQIDSEWLVLKFERDVVKEARVLED